MPYYIGAVIKDERKLTARTPAKFRESGIEVIINTKVEQIDPVGQVVRLDGGASLPYDLLALGTGTAPRMPGIPGEDMEGVFISEKTERCTEDQSLPQGDGLPEGHYHRGWLYRYGSLRGLRDQGNRNRNYPPG